MVFPLSAEVRVRPPGASHVMSPSDALAVMVNKLTQKTIASSIAKIIFLMEMVSLDRMFRYNTNNNVLSKKINELRTVAFLSFHE